MANLESVRVIESGSFSAGDWQRPLTRGEAAQLLSAAMTLAEKKQESAGLFRAYSNDTEKGGREGRLSFACNLRGVVLVYSDKIA